MSQQMKYMMVKVKFRFNFINQLYIFYLLML